MEALEDFGEEDICERVRAEDSFGGLRRDHSVYSELIQ